LLYYITVVIFVPKVLEMNISEVTSIYKDKTLL